MKMKNVFAIILILALNVSENSFAQSVNQHVSVSIHEDLINNYFVSIGEISGKGSKKVLGGKVKYTWKVKDPNINIESGTATFNAKVDIKAGKIKATKKAKGELDITYIKEKNVIKLKTKEIKVKLTFKMLGQKVNIGTIDLSNYYKPSFEFAGPQPIQNQIEFEMPDKTKKIINIESVNENLILEENRITVYSDFNFLSAAAAKAESLLDNQK